MGNIILGNETILNIEQRREENLEWSLFRCCKDTAAGDSRRKSSLSEMPSCSGIVGGDDVDLM